MFSRLVVLILLVWTHAYGLNVVADCGAIPCDSSGVCVDSWAAFQKCAHARTVFVPAGEFMIGNTVQVGVDAGNQQQSWTLRGEGWTSRLRWAHNGTLFEFPKGGRNVFISSIAIVGNGVSPKAVDATVFSFSSLALSEFHNVLMDSGGGSFFRTRDYIDTVSFTDCVLWEMTGVGYTLAEGAEVRIRGGRIVGPSLSTHLQNDSSIGVLITGNCGGVHVHGTDVIALGTGVLANNSSGKGSNRELFFTQATFDSNIIGVHIQDNSYVSVAGLWAASSLAHQVLIEGETAQFVAAGGTIFNGKCLCPTNRHVALMTLCFRWSLFHPWQQNSAPWLWERHHGSWWHCYIERDRNSQQPAQRRMATQGKHSIVSHFWIALVWQWARHLVRRKCSFTCERMHVRSPSQCDIVDD